MPKEKELSPSEFLASKVIYAAFQILKDHGNEMQMRDLMMEVEKKVDLNEWEKERYEKSGYIRWQSILHFFSIRCAGIFQCSGTGAKGAGPGYHY